jgi:hypothetical protein
MGKIYDFLDFLNDGTLPTHTERSKSSNVVLQEIIDRGRDALGETPLGEVVLWMLDHGVDLPQDKPDPVFDGSTFDREECSSSGGYSKIVITDLNYTDRFLRSTLDQSTHRITVRNTPNGGRETYHSSGRSSYFDSSSDASFSNNNVFGRDYTLDWITNPDGSFCCRFVDSGLFSLNFGFYKSTGPYENSLFTAESTVALFSTSDFTTNVCGQRVPRTIDAYRGSLEHNPDLYLSKCSVNPNFDTNQPDDELPVYGYFTVYNIGTIGFYPAFSQLHELSRDEAIRFLLSLPLLHVRVPGLVPLSAYDNYSFRLFGDLEPPTWYLV